MRRGADRGRGRRPRASTPRRSSAAQRRSPRCVKFGDPVLRSRRLAGGGRSTRASPRTSSGWSRSCATAWGSGWRRPSSGSCAGCSSSRRGPTRPPTALVNPEIEWRSDDLVTAEEGCLSLPGVVVDVERPLHVRVRGLDAERRPARDRGLGPRGAGDPARGGPPRRRADAPADARASSAAGALRALREGGTYAPRAPRRRPRTAPARRGRGRLRTAYLGTSDFAATVLRRARRERRTGPRLVVTPPDRQRGRGRQLASPPAAEAARELELELHQTADVNEPESVAALARGGAERGRRLRLRPADQGAAARATR